MIREPTAVSSIAPVVHRDDQQIADHTPIGPTHLQFLTIKTLPTTSSAYFVWFYAGVFTTRTGLVLRKTGGRD